VEGMKFGQFIITNNIKIVATRCQILRLKCTKINFSWGSAPDPVRRAYSTPPVPLAGSRGPTSKGREGKAKRREKGGEGSPCVSLNFP